MENSYYVCLIKWSELGVPRQHEDIQIFGIDEIGKQCCLDRAAILREEFKFPVKDEEWESQRKLRVPFGIPINIRITIVPVMITGIE